MKIRKLLQKINDAVRPARVGPREPTDIDSEERQWAEYMPPPQDDRPPH